MHFLNIIEQVSGSFIETFNQRDFGKLPLFLATGFYVKSENIHKIYPEIGGDRVDGIEKSIIYWQKLVQKFPDYVIDMQSHHISHEGKHILYSGKLKNGKPYHAKFTMNEYAKIECLIVSYPESI
jgi:hypothetical protein